MEMEATIRDTGERDVVIEDFRIAGCEYYFR
jgi:hypothetical protein